MRENLLRLLGLLLLLVGYQALARYAGWPGPGGIFLSLQMQWRQGLLVHDLEVSSARWMLGWIPGAIAGILLGLLTGYVGSIRSFLEPYRLMLRALPFIGLVPVVTRLFGTSETGKRILIAWIACSVCWPMVDNAAGSIPVHVLWKARTLEAGRVDRARLVLAYCQPAVFSALRTSLSLGWILVALVEMSGVYEQSSGNFWSEGLGYRLFRSQEDGQDGLMIAMLLTFALTGGAGEILLTCIWKSVKWIGRFLRRRQIRGAINALKRRVRTADVAWPKPGSLCVEDLSADYGGSLAFSKCSFSVAAGETLPILGESGSGKTTLLRAVAHLFGDGLHVEGRVLVDGELAVQDQRIGIVFQDALVFPMLTVWENAIYGKHARANPAYAYQLLVDFGISDLVTQGSDALSGGQRQRLALACALANAPRILLLDEPFGALDAITRYRLQEFFVTQIRGRTTCLFVTHDINEAIEVASEEIMVGLGERAKLLKVQQPEANSPRLMDHEYRSLHGTLKDALRSVHNGPSGFAVHR